MTKAAHVTSSVCLVLLLLPAHESIHAFLQEILRRPHTIVPDALTKNPQPKPVNIVDVDDQRSRRNLLVEHQYRHLQVDAMMPIHGRFVPYSEFVEAAIRMRSMTSTTPTTN